MFFLLLRLHHKREKSVLGVAIRVNSVEATKIKVSFSGDC